MRLVKRSQKVSNIAHETIFHDAGRLQISHRYTVVVVLKNVTLTTTRKIVRHSYRVKVGVSLVYKDSKPSWWVGASRLSFSSMRLKRNLSASN